MIDQSKSRKVERSKQDWRRLNFIALSALWWKFWETRKISTKFWLVGCAHTSKKSAKLLVWHKTLVKMLKLQMLRNKFSGENSDNQFYKHFQTCKFFFQHGEAHVIKMASHPSHKNKVLKSQGCFFRMKRYSQSSRWWLSESLKHVSIWAVVFHVSPFLRSGMWISDRPWRTLRMHRHLWLIGAEKKLKEWMSSIKRWL